MTPLPPLPGVAAHTGAELDRTMFYSEQVFGFVHGFRGKMEVFGFLSDA